MSDESSLSAYSGQAFADASKEIASLKAERDDALLRLLAEQNGMLKILAERDQAQAKCEEMFGALRLARAWMRPSRPEENHSFDLDYTRVNQALQDNAGQPLLDRLVEAERLVRSFQKELSDARAFGVSKSDRLEKLERVWEAASALNDDRVSTGRWMDLDAALAAYEED